MREREKLQRPPRPVVSGPEKTRPKPPSKSTEREKPQKPTKPAPEKAKAKPSTSKASTSSTSKASTSAAKPSGAAASRPSRGAAAAPGVAASRPPRGTGAATGASASKPPRSSGAAAGTSASKPPRGTEAGASSSSSRPPKTSSSNPRAPTESRRDKPSSSSRDARSDRTSSKKESEVRSKRDSSKGTSRGEKLSTNSSRSDRRDTKGASSQNREKDRAATSSRSQKGERSSTRESNRPKSSAQKPSSRSRSSKEESSRNKPSSDKVRSEKPSRHEDEQSKSSKDRKKDEKKKDEKNNRNEKTRTREKSAKERSSSRRMSVDRAEREARDSGVEGMSSGSSLISPPVENHEAEPVEQSQNSLETMESGISLSSPRDLSGDEVDVEESISSKMVEVDEVDEDELQEEEDIEGLKMNPYIGGGIPDAQQDNFDNLATASSSLLTHTDDADDYDYEDDFEDYESDFEDDSGSGNEDEEEESDEEDSEDDSEDDSEEEDDSDVRELDPNMVAVLQAMERENSLNSQLQRAFSIDEPNEQEMERPLTPVPDVVQVVSHEPVVEPYVPAAVAATPPQEYRDVVARPKTSRTFVNFASAKKKQVAAQLSSKMNSRGRALLNMIQLDTVNIDLLTLAPVSYEAYISSFGHSNTQQMSMQTNEDDLWEEVQTDEIITKNKWTQKPVHISIGKDNRLPEPEDYLGVGGDVDPESLVETSSKSANTGRLTSFLNSASQVMLALLEEELAWNLADSSTLDESNSSDGLGFSHPPVTMGTNVQPLLEGRPTPFVQFCATEPSMLLSGHGFHSMEEQDSVLNEGGLLCVWWVQEPSRPQQILSCRAAPTSAAFSPVRPSLILAGLEDGSLAAWDLREPLQYHSLKTDIDGVNWRVRVPSFVTACDESCEGEGSPIVAIQAVTSQEDVNSDTLGSFQVVTLTNEGRVTWWVVNQVPLVNSVGGISIGRKSASGTRETNKVGVSAHTGAAPWARIVLHRSATISVMNTLYSEEVLDDSVSCHDLKLNPSDTSQLYVATGSGAVAHCSRLTSRIYPKAYMPEIELGCEALCLAICPHDSRYLLVGSSDGIVRLHSTATERPLTSWQSSQDTVPIVSLQWSPARPCVFYVLDANSRLHLWDLSAGDIFPVLTVEAGGLVGGMMRSFNIAPTKATSRHPLYAVFASDGGELVLRQVSQEFCAHYLLDDYNTELERFTYYVNII